MSERSLQQMQIVADASFVIWSISTQDPAERERRTQVQEYAWRFRPVAPVHMLFEVGNALRKKFLTIDPPRRARIQEALLSGLQLETPGRDAFETIHTMTEQHGLSFSDASYLQLAAAHPTRVLLTQDLKLRTAAVAELGQRRALDAAAIELKKRQGARF